MQRPEDDKRLPELKSAEAYLRRRLGAGYDRIVSHNWGRLVLLSSVVTAVSDFFQAISPVVFYGLVVSVSIAIILSALSRTWIGSNGRLVPQIIVSIFFSAFFGATYFVQTATGNTDKGILAEQFAAAASAQRAVAEIISKLTRIESNTVGMRGDIAGVRTSLKNIERQTDVASAQVSREALKAALVSANSEWLGRFVPTSSNLPMVEQLFRAPDVAKPFFETAKFDENAIKWFVGQLNRNIDPNLILAAPPNGAREAILKVAYDQGNVKAVLALLKAGAFGHAYQDVSYLKQSSSFFMMPFTAILDDDRFTREEKKTLAEAFLAAGALVVTRARQSLNGAYDERMREVSDRLTGDLGIMVAPNDSPCPADVGLCRRPSLSGQPVCDFAAEMPHAGAVPGNSRHDFDNFQIVGLMGVYEGKAHYLAKTLSWHAEFAIIERSVDGTTLGIGKYTVGQPGIGWCGEGSNSNTYCWITYRAKFNKKEKTLSDPANHNKFNIGFCSRN
jgi:hypothetical protein